MSHNSNTVTIFVMTQKGYEVLKTVAKKHSSIIQKVIIGRDKFLDNDYSEEIRNICKTFNIDCTLKEDNPKITSNYAIAISWRWLIDFPTENLIILHDSPLPKYRGFAPLVNALINGESIIGVTAIYGASEYDRGDIILQRTSKIEYPITIQQAIELNNLNYIYIADEVLKLIKTGEPLPRLSQKEEDATYSIWRDESDYKIDWNLPARTICRTIDALGYPYSGAFTYDKENKIIIESAEEVEDVNCEIRDVGKIIFVKNGYPIVICGSGLLKITSAKVQKNDNSRESYLPVKKFRVRFK